MSGNEIEQNEGYAAALSVPGRAEQVFTHPTQETAVELLALRAMLVPLHVQEITATVVDLIDDRTVAEYTGEPMEVVAMLNGVTLTRVQRRDSDQWVRILDAFGFTDAQVASDHAGTYVAFTARDEIRYCLADEASADTDALVLTRDYRSIYNPENDTPDQRVQRYIYAATIRQAAEQAADMLLH
jgi:hypothetical protein